MWIRSQDKIRLINANEIWIKRHSDEFSIKCNTQSVSTGVSWDIGYYKTEERCIEILDDIQKEITNCLPANEMQFYIVYEMPEE